MLAHRPASKVMVILNRHIALLWCIGVLICSSDGVQLRTYDERPEYATPDRYGIRYCAYWKLADGSVIYPSCDPYKQERCGQPVEFEYKCCPGYRMSKPDDFGEPTCASVPAPWLPAVDILKELDVSQSFVDKLRNSRMLSGNEPKTIFVPESFGSAGFEEKFRSSDDLVKFHIGRNRYLTEDMKDGMELDSELTGEKLKITKYPFGVVCVECMEIVNGNLESKDGVIHIVRFPLAGRLDMPTNGRKLTLMELMQQVPATRDFAQDLPLEMKQKLSNYNDGDPLYTVMAPANWASIRQTYGSDPERLGKIAASHVYKDMLCSAGLIKKNYRLRRATTSEVDNSIADNEAGDALCSVSSDDTGVLTPGGQAPTDLNSGRYGGKRMMFEDRRITGDCGQSARLIRGDMTAKNGVLHITDLALVPLEAMTMDELMDSQKCVEYFQIKEFVQLLKECDLRKKEGEKYAIITPQDVSFTWWKNYQQFESEFYRFKNDPEYRCRVARYHIMRNNGDLDSVATFNGPTNGYRSNNINNYLYETSYMTKNEFGSELNFHYSPINDMKIRKLADGTSMYVTHRINVIPERNISVILEEEPEFSQMEKMTKKAQMKENVFDVKAPKNLYLVVKDKGWDDARWADTKETVDKLSTKVLRKFLSLHHVPLYLWGGDIGYFKPGSVTEFKASSGDTLIFWMNENGVMRIGHKEIPREKWPEVVRWNIPGRDGIIWVLEGPIGCTEESCEEAEDIDKFVISASACNAKEIKVNAKGTVLKATANRLHKYVKFNPNVCYTSIAYEKTMTRVAAEDQDYESK